MDEGWGGANIVDEVAMIRPQPAKALYNCHVDPYPDLLNMKYVDQVQAQ